MLSGNLFHKRRPSTCRMTRVYCSLRKNDTRDDCHYRITGPVTHRQSMKTVSIPVEFCVSFETSSIFLREVTTPETLMPSKSRDCAEGVGGGLMVHPGFCKRRQRGACVRGGTTDQPHSKLFTPKRPSTVKSTIRAVVFEGAQFS